MNTLLQQRGNKKKKGQDKEECTLSSCFRRPEPSDCLTHRPRCFSFFSVLQYLQCPGGWNDSKKKGVHIFSHSGGRGDVKNTNKRNKTLLFRPPNNIWYFFCSFGLFFMTSMDWDQSCMRHHLQADEGKQFNHLFFK